MDPLGLLAGVVALAVYPGGVALLAVVAAVRRSLPPALSPGDAAVLLLGLGACACVPLSGSVALRLPPSDGVPGNLGASLILLAAAAGWGRGPQTGRRWGAVGAVAAVIAVAALASAAAGFSFQAIDALGGPGGTAARALTAGALVLGAASLTAPVHPEAAPKLRRSMVVGTATVVAAGLLVPPLTQDWPAATGGALAVLGACLVADVAIRARHFGAIAAPLSVTLGIAALAVGLRLG